MTVLPVLDWARRGRRSTFLMQLDIEKAYDSVDREAMGAYFTRIGLRNNPFYRLIETAMTSGTVSVTGASGLSEPFLTTRGIR